MVFMPGQTKAVLEMKKLVSFWQFEQFQYKFHININGNQRVTLCASMHWVFRTFEKWNIVV